MTSSMPVVWLALALAAPAPKAATRPAAPAGVAGEWAYETWVIDGRPEPCAGRTIVFGADGTFQVRQDERPHGAGRYSVGPANDPPTLDLVEAGLPGPGRAIYKVEADTLTICLSADAAGERPGVLGAPAGSGLELLTFKRVKKPKD